MKSLRQQLEDMMENKDVISSFAKKSGKTPKEVDAMWNKIKASLLSQGHKESDKNFYALLVGSLKNSLKI